MRQRVYRMTGKKFLSVILIFSHKETYSSEEKAHSLHDINITIEKGKRIALIGESGSGKSTLMALLRGLYEPEPGTIVKVDNDNTNSTDVTSLRSFITLFPPQEPEIFENTIEHNITLVFLFKKRIYWKYAKPLILQKWFINCQKDCNQYTGERGQSFRGTKTTPGIGPWYTRREKQ
ncbi:MAG: ATP-binding cassette domain-containing protein [Bacteroidota bacterium]